MEQHTATSRGDPIQPGTRDGRGGTGRDALSWRTWIRGGRTRALPKLLKCLTTMASKLARTTSFLCWKHVGAVISLVGRVVTTGKGPPGRRPALTSIQLLVPVSQVAFVLEVVEADLLGKGRTKLFVFKWLSGFNLFNLTFPPLRTQIRCASW